MSIEGSINVSALFHDKDGTTAMKVASLRSSNEYTSGKVAVATGTAGTAVTIIPFTNTYRDASGALVGFAALDRICFSWSGTTQRNLQALGGESETETTLLLSSKNNQVASSSLNDTDSLQLREGSGTGTYTLLIYGT